MRLERLLEIVILLLNRRRITARALAERFEISIRTVYRDIEAINMAGVPVISTRGNGGGFTVLDNYTVDKRVLSLEELGSILTALKGLQSSLEKPELQRIIEKISGLIPAERTGELSRQMEMLVVEMTPWGLPGKRRELVRHVHQAILENRLLHFSYRNQKGEYSEREVEPMTLLYKGQTWYLFGWCIMRNGYRVFRLSRMRELQLLLRGFVRREASWKDHMDLDSPPAGVPMVNLLLRFRPEARTRVEDFFDEESIVCLDDGSLEVAVSFPEGDWITTVLLGYGADVKVLEPAVIRERVRQEAEKIASLYQI